MKYFAVITNMLDLEKNQKYREEHLDYLKDLSKKDHVFAKGRFSDASGGLVIYKADTLDEVRLFVENDPFIVQGARTYEIREWEMKLVE
ncbi:YciI family protein [Paenibacillus validus]|uniref:YCII-related domain-containing protein n=1 Tax=Paenibacillus validus TaxID=44253 RepID=A0A7X3CUP2_9BACL|nr:MULTISPECIES: YciI family protein [Paenibacillus]MED4599142.1 YciI family protein [Paenibacillus validus]MED4605425.1 YciI family protein [Paenibacillus validus]MUG72342.1 hypothetical protein [Paenibacillus validus]